MMKFFKYRSFLEPKTIGYITPEMATNGTTIIDHRDESLNVFILNDKDENEKTDSLKLFVEIYSSRKRTDREFWLLDVTHLISDKGYQNILNEMKDLKVDVDDDLFFFHYDQEGKEIKLFEFYEIHSTVPRQMLAYGTWDLKNGLILNDTEKWIRRRDLLGMSFRALSVVYEPFITSVEAIPGSKEGYQIDGLIADVFFGLQVCTNDLTIFHS